MQRTITQFRTAIYPSAISGFVIPSGCNPVIPSNDDYYNNDDGGFGTAVSIYFMYSTSYPYDMLPEDITYGVQT